MSKLYATVKQLVPFTRANKSPRRQSSEVRVFKIAPDKKSSRRRVK